jgi:FkbM family methyltransferase
MRTFVLEKNTLRITIEDDNADPNLGFWKDTFPHWESDTFKVFDKLLNPNKIFIDIGAWIGTTCIYGSKKSKYVYAIEADNKSFTDLCKNIKLNSENIMPINRAIFNVDDQEITFGKNKFLGNSKLNDSTSQIYLNSDVVTADTYSVKTISISRLLNMYSILPSDVSLIKVDIEGSEEYILDQLYQLHSEASVPLYISFHYSWWNDKNLDRFAFLSTYQKKQIYSNPFISILFN